MPRVVRVSDIKANLLRPATTSHFEVEIPIIGALGKWRGISKQDKIQLMCSEASLPGSNLATFIEVLVITATPMSLVTGIEDEKTWKTHTLKERGAEQ